MIEAACHDLAYARCQNLRIVRSHHMCYIFSILPAECRSTYFLAPTDVPQKKIHRLVPIKAIYQLSKIQATKNFIIK